MSDQSDLDKPLTMDRLKTAKMNKTHRSLPPVEPARPGVNAPEMNKRHRPLPPVKPARPGVNAPEKNKCFLSPLVKATPGHCPQACPLLNAVSTASAKALAGSTYYVLINGCFLEGHVLRRAHQETLEGRMCHQPDMKTTSGSQWMTEYKEHFGFPQLVHAPRLPKKPVHHVATNLRDNPEARFADKHRRTEYQSAYGRKGEETGAPGGNPRGMWRTCKLHTHGGGGNRTLNPGGVRQTC
ncbi:hypothetical protein QTP86_024868 [Hemibagrus guttatus]|nr:hypothetical protein QTP86_024868 [Hemibagrus guttatus]